MPNEKGPEHLARHGKTAGYARGETVERGRVGGPRSRSVVTAPTAKDDAGGRRQQGAHTQREENDEER